MSKFTKFDYLLNSMLDAGRNDKPADHGYGEKRAALYAHVRALEAVAKAAEKMERAKCFSCDCGADPDDWDALRAALSNLGKLP